ncbi:MAG: hypothetical protein E7158_04015 [Firmicutes bacterium]|nr:hypothetical protein [Bacillota bacterium]
MNVIFLDFDGVLFTSHNNTQEQIEKRISILGDICKEYNCKVVIESSHKYDLDEFLNTKIEWLENIFELFDKYGIDCIGKTPSVQKRIGCAIIEIWKEDEIELYLNEHPEIEHFCIIDDDDLGPNNSDLNKFRDHLVQTTFYSDNYEEEGLLEIHKKQVGKVLMLDRKNKISVR